MILGGLFLIQLALHNRLLGKASRAGPDASSSLPGDKASTQESNIASLPRVKEVEAFPSSETRAKTSGGDPSTPSLKKKSEHREDSSLLVERKPKEVLEFGHQDGAVIVTKIHGPHQVFLLEQSLCLLHHAYNSRPLHDILVFTTTPLSEDDESKIRLLVEPAKLTVVVDNRGLQQEIAALSPTRRRNFLQNCNVTSPANLTWWSECPGRIAYNWQAEFRSLYLWWHPALAKYKWMMWLDSDAFCTRIWERDPMAAVIRNDLVMLFANMEGMHKGEDVHDRIYRSFNKTLCAIRIRDGHLEGVVGGTECYGARIRDIHGFFHITNLDFYRSDNVRRWAQNWIGDGFLQRKYDDQCGVTVPAAILAPERSWSMTKNGIYLDIFHNSFLDGKRKNRAGGFLAYWNSTVRHQMPAGAVCPITAAK